MRLRIKSGGVGGRNLLLGTINPATCTTQSVNEFVTFDIYSYVDGGLKQHGLVETDFVTVSFDWQISQNGSNAFTYGSFRVEGVSWDAANVVYPNFYGPVSGVTTFSADHTKDHLSFSCNLAANTNRLFAQKFRIRIDNSNLKMTISHCKVEIGQIATDYCPAYEDLIDITSDEIQQLKTKLGS